MHRLSLIAICLLCFTQIWTQNPHGEDFAVDCASCHNPGGWTISIDTFHFNHDTTSFPLSGQHALLDCKLCHVDFIFGGTSDACIDCHHDIHRMTVGDDCARCHTNDNWLVDDIPELHESNGFPLTGVHAGLFCIDCHDSDNLLTFNRLGNDCINCHEEDYDNTMDPNHAEEGFSKDCFLCHSTSAFDWEADVLDHSFFPLTMGHDTRDCKKCHLSDDYADISSDCISCHLSDFQEAEQPDHELSGFDTDCTMCHTTSPDWRPAQFLEHDIKYFPIYSGEHEGEWDDCIDCHTVQGDFTQFSCTNCHERGETDEEHDGVTGYVYEDRACYACHPNGSEDGAFDHNTTSFPLTGAHIGVECLECHTERFGGTSTDCFSCHEIDFEGSLNPDHQELNLSNDCINCHTTDPDWMPAGFDIHDQFYELRGAHAMIANDCATCHNGDYNNTPNDCIGCHQDDFDNTIDPDHGEAGFSTDCTMCHTEDSWTPSVFDHDEFYVLQGAHALIANDCVACHEDGFDNTPTNCFGCHESDYNETMDPDHMAAGFNTDCTVCHNETAWVPSNFDHDAEHFPIYSGAHEGEWTECVDCHTNPDNYMEFTCINCHTNPETDEEHDGVTGYIYEDRACFACHPMGDADKAFNHDNTEFPLTGAHIGLDCFLCHADGFAGTSTECVSCHQPDFLASVNPDHQVLNLSTDCINCHTTELDWMPASFDVHNDFYELRGAHAMIANDCVSCHNGDYINTPDQCIGCHQDDFNNVMEPDHNAAGFSTDCTQCHTEDAWMPSTFDHDQYYVLEGAHALIANDCAACHIDGEFSNTPNTCIGCHTEDYNGVVDPNHVLAGFDTDCTTCHTQNAWLPSTFDHDVEHFPIYSGKHDGEWMMCTDCHNVVGDFSQFTCINCHINPETDEDHDGVTGYIYNDNACFGCHPNGDADMAFDHNMTNFPLTGAHIGVDCLLCHSDGYVGTSTECMDCHLTDHQMSLNPSHNTLGISTDCINCHTTDPGWTPATFDVHDQYYPLIGAHAMIANDCVTCHNGDYNNTPNTCYACHQADYDATTNPNHTQVQFGTDCVVCHNETAWMPADFDHDMQFFPINSGAHLGVWSECIECHIVPDNFEIFSCVVCHLNPETDMEHVAVNGYIYEDNACFACHPDGTADMAFDHNATAFPLTGAHLGVDCLDCHENGFENTPTDCFFCHELDYNSSSNPDHLDLGFPTDCNSCHTTDPGWTPATFDIHDNYYPLTGAHVAIADDCVACHNGDYNNTPSDCVGCHISDYNMSSNPDHQELQIPTDCINCHTTDPGWTPATFDIHDDYYPLNGAHSLIADDCMACHNGDYNNTPNDCVGCHLDDYNSTVNPDHAQAQFSTDCITCHTEDAWMPSTFDHDVQHFPIYSGSHNGEWSVCMDCHTDPNDFSVFTCIGCHLNPETDDEHDGIGGYVYEDNACLACHPDGESMGAIDHDATGFPLTGAHLGLDCLDCHSGGYAGTPTECFACHSTDYNSSNNPDHSSLGIPTDCDDCHTTGPGWTPATFDIHDDYYELTGAHQSVATDCVLCHNGDYNNTPNTCDGCHLADYNNTSNPDHPGLGIPTDCDDCHTTDPGWTPATFEIHDDYYELTGAHQAIENDCVLCHNGDYSNTPNTCDGCHLPDYNSTSNPDHQDLNLPLACDECHTTDAGWMPASFDIHDDYYQLNGYHATIASECVLCHDGDYNNTPNTCAGCHQDDYDNATDPDHEQNNLSLMCTDCHNEDAWSPTDWDHDDFWPLSGAHADIANQCFDCHMGDFNNTPTDCFSCHEDDYNDTSDPDHAAAMFPTDCTLCHDEDAWTPSTFDHDALYFPIYSGKHDGEWNLCTDCHLNNDYTSFSCIDCHEHDDEAEVDDDHEDVNDYVYESQACYSCHPTGED